MSTATSGILFASERLRATLHDAGAPERPLVVTFDSLSTDLSLDRPGFGQAWLAEIGYDAVHVVSDRNGWYQDRDMPALLAAVRAAVAGRRRVVTYGSSMGGYAAVRLAGRLGAHAAVALSPQFSVDPAAAPWESRWTEYVHGRPFPLEAPGQDVVGAEQVFLIFDPLNRDRLHAEALARRGPVILAPVRRAGHPAGTFLAEAGLLPETIQAMIEDRFDPQRFREQVRAARRRSAVFHHGLALCQPARRVDLAVRLATEAVRLSPDTTPYHAALGARLAQAGDLRGAEAALRRAYELDPCEPGARLALAEHLALHGGDPDEVRSLARGLEAMGAVREWLFVRAADLLFAVGAFPEARDEARSALARLPHSPRLRLRAWGLGALLAIPGLGPIALGHLRRRLLRRALGGRDGKIRLVGATGFEPATP